DGIRDLYVTGVQTCALPISGSSSEPPVSDDLTWAGMSSGPSSVCDQYGAPSGTAWSNQVAKSRRTSGEAFSFRVSEAEVCWMNRSEERRVGKEGGSRWAAWQ